MNKNTKHKLSFSTEFDDGQVVNTRMFVTTRPGIWVNTGHPIILPISIHSVFHEGNVGKAKMTALIEMVKTNVKSTITILFTEKAHLETLRVKYQTHASIAFEKCYQDAIQLKNRLANVLEDCMIMHWNEFVDQDPHYLEIKQQVLNLFGSDEEFRQLLKQDAEMTYTSTRSQEFNNKQEYVRAVIVDLLEQCVYHLITSGKGYRYEFYSGKRYRSVELIGRKFLSDDQNLTRINVSLHNPQFY